MFNYFKFAEQIYIRNFVTKLGELVVISNKIIIIGTNFP